MGLSYSEPYDHHNLLTDLQLESLSKREAQLSTVQRRQRYVYDDITCFL